MFTDDLVILAMGIQSVLIQIDRVSVSVLFGERLLHKQTRPYRQRKASGSEHGRSRLITS
jgi:hypothetical protein